MLRGTSVFSGCTVQARDGKAGHISDVLFDGVTWKIKWLVVDMGSWTAPRLVLIHPPVVTGADAPVDRLHVDLTWAQVSHSRDILRDPPVYLQMEGCFQTADGQAVFWDNEGLGSGSGAYRLAVPPLFGDVGSNGAPVTCARLEDQDPNLRSVRQVSGYHATATDGQIGHVLEFLLDDEAWVIRFLIIDTRNWLPGPHVMLAPSVVTEIDYWRRSLVLNVTRDQVRNSPLAWDPAKKAVSG